MPRKLHLLSVYVVCWIFWQTFQTYFCIQANSVDPDLRPHCFIECLLKSQADDKAGDNCCDWQFKGYTNCCLIVNWYHIRAGLGGSVGCTSDWRLGGRGLDPHRGRQYSFEEIDHEICSTVILSLPLIQEGHLSVSGERMCTIHVLVNCLED